MRVFLATMSIVNAGQKMWENEWIIFIVKRHCVRNRNDRHLASMAAPWPRTNGTHSHQPLLLQNESIILATFQVSWIGTSWAAVNDEMSCDFAKENNCYIFVDLLPFSYCSLRQPLQLVEGPQPATRQPIKMLLWMTCFYAILASGLMIRTKNRILHRWRMCLPAPHIAILVPGINSISWEFSDYVGVSKPQR